MATRAEVPGEQTPVGQAEQRARLLAAVVEKSRDFIAIANLDGSVVFVNAAGRALVGLTPDEDVTRLSRRDFVPPEFLPVFEAEIAPAVRDRGEWFGPAFLLSRTGRRIPTQNAVFTIPGPDGRPQLVATVQRDLSEQHGAEAALRESLHWLRESQRTARLGHYVLTFATGTWTASETLDEIFGLGPADRHDVESWERLLHEDDQRATAQYLTDLARSGTRFDRVYRIKRGRDGEVRWVHGLGHVSRDERGVAVQMFGTIQDVTEKLADERAREALGEQLRQSQKMEAIGRLAGGIAHDFNNLLTSIVGSVSLALEGLHPGDPLHELLEDIDKTSQRAAALTRQLLAFSRRQLMEPRAVSPNALVQNVERLLARLVGEDVVLELDLAPQTRAVRADPGQLEQVLVNLAVNARDAMPGGGRLVLRTREAVLDEGFCRSRGLPPGPHVGISVADTGVGIPAEDLPRVFEPFFTTKPAGKGTGLGLATAYGIVKQHGGAIDVTSSPGRGATFEVWLPAVEEAPQQAAGAAPVPEAGTERILLVEDERVVRSVAARHLARLGYAVSEFANGPEALAAVAAGLRPDVVVTDVVMPGMNGRVLAETLRRERPELPVLYTSGYTADVMDLQGVGDEGLDFLPKPYTPSALAAHVRELLDRKRHP